MIRRVIAFIILFGIAAFLYVSPAWISERTGVNLFREWREPKADAFTGIIEVWHIVGVKPHTGSMSTWFEAQAKRCEKHHTTVFIHVTAMTQADYDDRIAQGYFPDILSFPSGLEYADKLLPLDTSALGDTIAQLRDGFASAGMYEGELYALPFMYSGLVLMANNERLSACGAPTDLTEIDNTKLTGIADTVEIKALKHVSTFSGDPLLFALMEQHTQADVADIKTFREGNAALASGTLRDVGDMERRNTAGKGFSFSAVAVSDFTTQVQLISISREISVEKMLYAYEFLESLFTDTAQAEIYERNAYGVTSLVDTKLFDNPLKGIALDAFALYRTPKIPNAFAYRQKRDAVNEAALGYIHDTSTHDDFMNRMTEIIG